MKDNHDAKAAGFMAQYGYADSYARDDLADLLRATAGAARNEAIEEAANAILADGPVEPGPEGDGFDNGVDAARDRDVAIIRSLSTNPAGGHDGG